MPCNHVRTFFTHLHISFTSIILHNKHAQLTFFFQKQNDSIPFIHFMIRYSITHHYHYICIHTSTGVRTHAPLPFSVLHNAQSMKSASKKAPIGRDEHKCKIITDLPIIKTALQSRKLCGRKFHKWEQCDKMTLHKMTQILSYSFH